MKKVIAATKRKLYSNPHPRYTYENHNLSAEEALCWFVDNIEKNIVDFGCINIHEVKNGNQRHIKLNNPNAVSDRNAFVEMIRTLEPGWVSLYGIYNMPDICAKTMWI